MLENVPLFASLNPLDLAKLELGMFTQHFAKNSVLINQCEVSNRFLYVILSGKLKAVLKNEEGREVLLSIMGEGDSFGELSLFDEEPRSASVIALEDCFIGLLPAPYFFDCLRGHPDIAIGLLKISIRRMRNMTCKINGFALCSVYGRIADALADMAKPTEDGKMLTAPITQKELASIVGASREIVSRVLNELKRGGHIQINKRRIEILKSLPIEW